MPIIQQLIMVVLLIWVVMLLFEKFRSPSDAPNQSEWKYLVTICGGDAARANRLVGRV